MEEIKVVNSIDEITDIRTKYAHISSPKKWIEIRKGSDGRFDIYGMICGSLPTWVANGVMVKSWKTFNGVIRALKGFSKSGAWGMRHWANEQTPAPQE